jgi:hypothetical protein
VAAGLPNLVNRFEDRRIVTVMQARSPDELNEALAETNLAPEEVVVDLENDYGAALGVQLRPAAVVVRDGIATEGAVVRSPRQLLEVLEGIETPVEAALDTSEARHLHSHEAEV